MNPEIYNHGVTWEDVELILNCHPDRFVGSSLRTLFYAYKKNKNINEEKIQITCYTTPEGESVLEFENPELHHNIDFMVGESIWVSISDQDWSYRCDVIRFDLAIEALADWLTGALTAQMLRKCDHAEQFGFVSSDLEMRARET